MDSRIARGRTSAAAAPGEAVVALAALATDVARIAVACVLKLMRCSRVPRGQRSARAVQAARVPAAQESVDRVLARVLLYAACANQHNSAHARRAERRTETVRTFDAAAHEQHHPHRKASPGTAHGCRCTRALRQTRASHRMPGGELYYQSWSAPAGRRTTSLPRAFHPLKLREAEPEVPAW